MYTYILLHVDITLLDSWMGHEAVRKTQVHRLLCYALYQLTELTWQCARHHYHLKQGQDCHQEV